MPLVFTNHTLLKELGKIVEKHLCPLQMIKTVKQIFSLDPMVLFPEGIKFANYLLRAKLYPLERLAGAFKCHGKCCQVCSKKSDTFYTAVAHKEYKINQKFNGNEKCLFY